MNNKSRRPSITYDKFVEAWELLVDEGRASINTALDILGGKQKHNHKFS